MVASTPAISSARLLAQVVCPSMSDSTTGFSGVTGSSSSTEGNPPPDRVWSQRPPTIHAPEPEFGWPGRQSGASIPSRSAIPVKIHSPYQGESGFQMHVSVDQARNDRAAVEIDHFRGFADPALHLPRSSPRGRTGRPAPPGPPRPESGCPRCGSRRRAHHEVCRFPFGWLRTRRSDGEQGGGKRRTDREGMSSWPYFRFHSGTTVPQSAGSAEFASGEGTAQFLGIGNDLSEFRHGVLDRHLDGEPHGFRPALARHPAGVMDTAAVDDFPEQQSVAREGRNGQGQPQRLP